MTENGYTLSDIAAVSGGCRNNNDGMFGGDWSAWIILFLLFGLFGGNGWGGGFGGGSNGSGFQGYATRADINEGFALNNLQSGITAIQQGICDSTYALNNTLTSGFHGVDSALCNLGYNTQSGFNALSAQLAQCCCDQREAISNVRYDMATQNCATLNTIQNTTRDVIDAVNSGNRQLLDFLVNDKISSLTAENQSLKFAASQAQQNAYIAANQEAQTAELIRRLGADCPTPAYVVQPPTPVNFPLNACGQFTGYANSGCGCSGCGSY